MRELECSQPMRPVESRVVRGRVRRHRHRTMPQRAVTNIGAEPDPAPVLPATGDDARRNPLDGGRTEVPPHLAPLLTVQPPVQFWMPHPRHRRKRAQHDPVSNTDDCRHRDGGSKDGEDNSRVRRVTDRPVPGRARWDTAATAARQKCYLAPWSDDTRSDRLSLPHVEGRYRIRTSPSWPLLIAYSAVARPWELVVGRRSASTSR